METMYITNKVGRVVQVEKNHWLKLIASKQATPFYNRVKDKLYKMTKSSIMEKLDKANIKYDPFAFKEDLFDLLPKD